MSVPAGGMPEPRGALARTVRTVEYTLLALLFLAVVVIGLAQIALRNLAGTGLPWADPAMRAGVLWIAMLAGVLASGTAQHIRIDALLPKIPVAMRPWIDRGVLIATALICITLAAASIEIVRLEYQFSDLAFGPVPRWLVLAIIPTGFGLMSLRFLYRALLPGAGASSAGGGSNAASGAD